MICVQIAGRAQLTAASSHQNQTRIAHKILLWSARPSRTRQSGGRVPHSRTLPRCECRGDGPGEAPAALDVAPDEDFDWALRHQGALRTVPLAAGGLGIAAVLVNRLASGIAPVVDASSAQSRADVLAIGLSAVLLLTGLQWLSLRPKPLTSVEPDADFVEFFEPSLPDSALRELEWLWRALQLATRCRGVVVVVHGRGLMHCGMIRRGRAPGTAAAGPIAQAAMATGRGSYLANLILYPGRVEFTEFFPENTQGVLVQPIGDGGGVLIAGTDTQRGFGFLDQAWIAAIADKLDSTLAGSMAGREEEEAVGSTASL